jgi:hypothetical protein
MFRVLAFVAGAPVCCRCARKTLQPCFHGYGFYPSDLTRAPFWQNVLSDFLLVDPYRPGSLSAAFEKLNLPIVLK